MKDVWHTNIEDMELEGDILGHLCERGVSSIPSLVSHRDVIIDGTCMQLVYVVRF